MLHRAFMSLSVGLSLALAGCTSNDISGPESAPNFVLSARAAVAMQKPLGESLQLTSVKVLLKRARLHTSTSEDSADIQEGPLAVVLNPGGAKTDITLSTIPEGSYDRIRFRLHKPEETEPIPDPEFRSGTSGDERYSVIVRGTWNGMPFLFRSRQNAEQQHELRPPLRVTSGSVVEVTLLVDPYSWFEGPGGTLDPTLEQNADLIDERIRESFCRVEDRSQG